MSATKQEAMNGISRACQEQEGPKSDGLLKRFSTRQVSLSWLLVILAALPILACIFWYASSHRTAQKKITEKTRTSVMIPDAEITESFLRSFTTNSGFKKNKTQEKSTSVKQAPVRKQLRPVGPMAIYISDEASGSLGALGIPMGTELEAVIENSVVASDRSVPVIARLTQTFMRDGNLVLPKNALLFGQTGGAVEDRLSVKFSRVVFPTGQEFPFSAVALDRSGAGGIQGKVKRKKGSRGLAVLGGAALGATSIFMPGGSSYGDAFARSAHRGAMTEAGRDFSHYRRTGASPIITIPANTRITVLVDRSS